MAEMKNKLSINFSFLTLVNSTKQQTHKFPKTFEEPNGVVGLGILAALKNNNDHVQYQDSIFMHRNRAAVFAANPIPILGNQESFEKMEVCEEYTCVISHVGGDCFKKREYFEDYFLENDHHTVSESICDDDAAAVVVVSDHFLSACFQCKKMLHGLDIFMYRGEKAFCSEECRYRQISIDEQKEKCQTGVRKPMECSVSPCSGTLQFYAGLAAA